MARKSKAAALAEREREILHETENLYLNSKLEILLNGNTHAVKIGQATSIDQATRVMGKLELYPKALRQIHQ